MIQNERHQLSTIKLLVGLYMFINLNKTKYYYYYYYTVYSIDSHCVFNSMRKVRYNQSCMNHDVPVLLRTRRSVPVAALICFIRAKSHVYEYTRSTAYCTRVQRGVHVYAFLYTCTARCTRVRVATRSRVRAICDPLVQVCASHSRVTRVARVSCGEGLGQGVCRSSQQR